ELHRTLVEERPVGTIVADIPREAGLSLSQREGMTYSVMSGGIHDNLFDVEEMTGMVRTAARVDRDVICPKAFECSAEVRVGMRWATNFHIIVLFIDVLDINDNSPVFPAAPSGIVQKISETTSPGVLFPIQEPVDNDHPDNSTKRFELVASSGKFELQVTNNTESSGTVDLNLLLSETVDREQRFFYQMKIIAYDGGEPSKSGTVKIDIEIEDSNDNSPRFENETYTVNVREDFSVNNILVTLQATDKDSGLNGEITYRLSDKTKRRYGVSFALDPKSGALSLARPLDYEKESEYILGVLADDAGPGGIAGSTTVHINVEDVNDNAPSINVETADGSDEIMIEENSQTGTFVALLSSYDIDSGDNGFVTCSVDNENFRIAHLGDGDYKIVTSRVMDREEHESHLLLIECNDLGNPMQSSSRNITIRVSDINDHVPVFEHNQYNVSMYENNERNAFVVKVKAIDRDASKEGAVIYMLSEQAQEHVSIYVTDKNDNAPVIDFPSPGNSTVSMSLDAEEGSVVATVRAHDIDLGTNAVLYYMISEGNEGGEFIIKEQNGQVILNMPGEQLRKTAYELVIMVRDSGAPPQIAVSTLNVILRETSLVPIPGSPTDNPTSGRSSSGGAADGLSQTTLTIIICVVAGFLIVALVLAIAI
ncbi:hypothetical protein CAPTEDRAFT_33363, partial [Capitella teleta]